MSISPRPWKINPEFIECLEQSTFAAYPDAILDANGKCVVGTSEWLTLTLDDANFIVAAVNNADS